MKRALLCLIFLFTLSSGVSAQVRDVQSIAAVVNHDVISVFDLLERMKLVIVSSDLKDTPETRQRLLPLVLRSLIDERLELQEADRLEIKVSDDEIEKALTQIEGENKIEKGQIREFFAKAGVDLDTVINQVKANIAWGKVIRRKIRPSIDISDDEINEAYARIEANKDKPQNLLAEIFLAVNSPDKEPEVKAIADRLVREIRDGASFMALARQFSESASALNGGDIGWVTEGQLGPELDAVLKTLRPPTLTEPIRTPGGYYILALRDRQVPAIADQGGTTISLREEQVAIPAGISKQDLAARMTEAKTFRDRVKSCEELDSMGQQAGWTSSGDLGWVHVEELPDDLRKVVDTLQVKKASEPLRRSEGLTVVMICERQEKKSVIPSRDDVADALLRQRIELQADRYLRDLRSNASVDTRI